ALGYLGGIFGGWWLMNRLVTANRLWPQGSTITREHVGDLVIWVTIGIVVGGRLGYVLFYNPAYFADNPGEIFAVWSGGMAFHGGFLGVVIALIMFARKYNIPMLSLGDAVACVVPIGLLLVRGANFINGELWGRPTDVPWGMVFPGAGHEPRHPSQLYEAGLEGLALFALLLLLAFAFKAFARPGLLIGVFFVFYGASRIFVENFREPDAHLGFIAGPLTMGMILSLPMIIAGMGFLIYAMRQPKQAA
ncbi:MAG: prolipoprotein diacylglyceryl transferase, partial [Alphaproteobacteria bacterium]